MNKVLVEFNEDDLREQLGETTYQAVIKRGVLDEVIDATQRGCQDYYDDGFSDVVGDEMRAQAADLLS